MTSPILPLRAAILARCGPDPTLAGLMGGAVHLWDEPPRNAPPLYGVFGPCEARDASTSSDRGHEQELSLVVWARPGSAASALAAAERMAELLDDAPLAPAGHRLVHLSVTSLAADRDGETNLARATLRLRAVTEILG